MTSQRPEPWPRGGRHRPSPASGQAQPLRRLANPRHARRALLDGRTDHQDRLADQRDAVADDRDHHTTDRDIEVDRVLTAADAWDLAADRRDATARARDLDATKRDRRAAACRSRMPPPIADMP